MYFRKRPGLGIALAFLLLLGGVFASILLGLTNMHVSDVLEALTRPTERTEHIIIRTVRLPRAAIATGVGAALGVAGALMQALTGNPLASPGILGVNAGATLFVVLALFLLQATSLATYTWAAFLGAAVTGAAVYGLGAVGRSGMTPLRLAVAGAALSALLASITQGILVLNERTMDEIRFWLAGSVAGRDPHRFLRVLPYLLGGLILALLLGRAVTALSLGADVAQSLGQRTAWVKGAAALAVVLLAGGSVAVAGPIGFVGLAVPHISRKLVGPDYRWVLPYSALLGAFLVLAADVGARLVIRPQELPVGVMTALLGAPFFIYLARTEAKRK